MAQDDRRMFYVDVAWDKEAQVWTAICDDMGLAVEGDTLDLIKAEVEGTAPDLIKANFTNDGLAGYDVILRVPMKTAA